MSKADKMFEKLGYEKDEAQEFIIFFKKELRYKSARQWNMKLVFNIQEKYLMTTNIIYYPLELLQAINKKVKELGWEE